MLYKNTYSVVRYPDSDTDFFEIVAGMLQGDILASYIIIIWLDYILRTSVDTINDNGFT